MRQNIFKRLERGLKIRFVSFCAYIHVFCPSVSFGRTGFVVFETILTKSAKSVPLACLRTHAPTHNDSSSDCLNSVEKSARLKLVLILPHAHWSFHSRSQAQSIARGCSVSSLSLPIGYLQHWILSCPLVASHEPWFGILWSERHRQILLLSSAYLTRGVLRQFVYISIHYNHPYLWIGPI